MDNEALRDQINLAKDALNDPGASRFLNILNSTKIFFEKCTSSPDSVVDCILSASKNEVANRVFLAICAAIKSFREKAPEEDVIDTTTGRAAVALYILAACRLVDTKIRSSGDFTFSVKLTEPVICAVIATALFGGELHLSKGGNGEPKPPYVFQIVYNGLFDQYGEDAFARAVYMEMKKNDENIVDIGLDSGPLTASQKEELRSLLKIRFNFIKNSEGVSGSHCLALIVYGETWSVQCHKFASDHKIPIFFGDPEAERSFFGVTEMELKQYVREFWGLMLSKKKSEKYGGKECADTSAGTGGEKNMPESKTPFGAPGGISIKVGDHSTVIVGSKNENIANKNATTDGDALKKVLGDLIGAIEASQGAKRPADFDQDVQKIKDESRQESPNHHVIEAALNSIDSKMKKGIVLFEGGEKIAGYIYKTYELLRPFLT